MSHASLSDMSISPCEPPSFTLSRFGEPRQKRKRVGSVGGGGGGSEGGSGTERGGRKRPRVNPHSEDSGEFISTEKGRMRLVIEQLRSILDKEGGWSHESDDFSIRINNPIIPWVRLPLELQAMKMCFLGWPLECLPKVENGQPDFIDEDGLLLVWNSANRRAMEKALEDGHVQLQPRESPDDPLFRVLNVDSDGNVSLDDSDCGRSPKWTKYSLQVIANIGEGVYSQKTIQDQGKAAERLQSFMSNLFIPKPNPTPPGNQPSNVDPSSICRAEKILVRLIEMFELQGGTVPMVNGKKYFPWLTLPIALQTSDLMFVGWPAKCLPTLRNNKGHLQAVWPPSSTLESINVAEECTIDFPQEFVDASSLCCVWDSEKMDAMEEALDHDRVKVLKRSSNPAVKALFRVLDGESSMTDSSFGVTFEWAAFHSNLLMDSKGTTPNPIPNSSNILSVQSNEQSNPDSRPADIALPTVSQTVTDGESSGELVPPTNRITSPTRHSPANSLPQTSQLPDYPEDSLPQRAPTPPWARKSELRTSDGAGISHRPSSSPAPTRLTPQKMPPLSPFLHPQHSLAPSSPHLPISPLQPRQAHGTSHIDSGFMVRRSSVFPPLPAELQLRRPSEPLDNTSDAPVNGASSHMVGTDQSINQAVEQNPVLSSPTIKIKIPARQRRTENRTPSPSDSSDIELVNTSKKGGDAPTDDSTSLKTTPSLKIKIPSVVSESLTTKTNNLVDDVTTMPSPESLQPVELISPKCIPTRIQIATPAPTPSPQGTDLALPPAPLSNTSDSIEMSNPPVPPPDVTISPPKTVSSLQPLSDNPGQVHPYRWPTYSALCFVEPRQIRWFAPKRRWELALPRPYDPHVIPFWMMDARVLWDTQHGLWQVCDTDDGLPFAMTWNRAKVTWELQLASQDSPLKPSRYGHQFPLYLPNFPGTILFDPYTQKWRYSVTEEAAMELNWPLNPFVVIWEPRRGAWELQDPSIALEGDSVLNERIVWNHDDGTWDFEFLAD